MNAGQIKAALLVHPMIEDCALLLRDSEHKAAELVAYVVTSSPVEAHQLRSYLIDVLPGADLPLAFVSSSCLPLTAEGRIDESRLKQIPVLDDDDLLRRWENCLRAVDHVDHAVVVLHEQTPKPRFLHISDLLDGWQPNAEDGGHQLPPDRKKTVGTEASSKSTRPAVSHGQNLRLEAETPRTLPQMLRHAALHSADRGIYCIERDGSEVFHSYASLLQGSQRVLSGLRQLGLCANDRVILQFDNIENFFHTLWGCILGGIVPIPIAVPRTFEDRNSAVEKLNGAWRLLEEPIVVADERLVPELRGLSKLLDLNGWVVQDVEGLKASRSDANWHSSQPDDVALMMLTSGSTGMPKAVKLSHHNLVSRSVASTQMNRFTAQEVSVNWMPLDHVAGLLYFHLRDVYLGCQQIHSRPELILLEPLKWLELIDRFRASVTFAPNFAYGLINDRADEVRRRNWDLSSMRHVLNGAEPIVPKTARRFLQLLVPYGMPATAMRPAWGMSETSSGVTYSSSFSLDSTTDDDLSVDLGVPIPGFSMRIVDSVGRVVEECTPGSLQVKGDTVTSGYYQQPHLNAEVFTDDGWFKTGDLAFLRNRRLTITGREKDVIIINGINYYSHQIEAVVEELEGVNRTFTAACAVRDDGTDTDKLAIFFNTSIHADVDLLQLLRDVRTSVAQKCGVNPDYILPLEQEGIPKTEIGKIQRTLIAERFVSGDFNAIVKRLDFLTGSSNTIPDWFYRKIWRRKQLVDAHPEKRRGVCVIFLDEIGLGLRVCSLMQIHDVGFVKVEVGTDFEAISPRHFRIDATNQDHYCRILKILMDEGVRVDSSMHLGTYSEYIAEMAGVETLNESQNLGVYSALYWIQALARIQAGEHPVRLLVVSSNSQRVHEEDLVAYEKGSLIGLAKTIPQEMPWIDCRHLDLPVSEIPPNAERLLGELEMLTKDAEVAYRHGQRWVSRLEKVDVLKPSNNSPPFKRGGMYLITGGLGGIGVEVAKYLLDRFGAKLLLVGRTQLTSGSRAQVLRNQSNGGLSERLAALQKLEQCKGTVRYEAVDISDETKLRGIVEDAEVDWTSRLDGIIHLAGVFKERMLIEETRESFGETLKPKLTGTWTLHKVLKQRPGALFVSFSSVNGFFGGYAAGAYSAANSCIEAFTDAQRSQQIQSFCFAWGPWDETGMNRARVTKQLAAARGYHSLSPRHGLASLHAGLRLGHPKLIVGLDGDNSHIRTKVEAEGHALQELTGYFSSEVLAAPVEQLKHRSMKDRFGSDCECSFKRIASFPFRNNGEVDREALVVAARNGESWGGKRIAPRTKIEQVIASIWGGALKLETLSIQDNFFDIGGNSLLAAETTEKLIVALSQKISSMAIYQYPTIKSLAQYLSSHEDVSQSPEVDLSKQRGAARRNKMQRRTRSAPTTR